MVSPRNTPKGLAYAGAAGTVLLLGFALVATLPAGADHVPANKVAVAGSTIEILTTPITEGSTSQEALLLEATIRASQGIDLILQLTYECALWTDVGVIGNDQSEAVATVKSWVEIDGVAVPVTPDTEVSTVTLCNRAYGLQVLNADDEDQQIQQYLSTKASNAFNWAAVDLSEGLHDISVFGLLEAQVTGLGTAQAGIGSRTLIVEPVQLAGDA